MFPLSQTSLPRCCTPLCCHVLQIQAPAKTTGNMHCQWLPVYEKREHAALAYDIANTWRALRGICGVTKQNVRWHAGCWPAVMCTWLFREGTAKQGSCAGCGNLATCFGSMPARCTGVSNRPALLFPLWPTHRPASTSLRRGTSLMRRCALCWLPWAASLSSATSSNGSCFHLPPSGQSTARP